VLLPVSLCSVMVYSLMWLIRRRAGAANVRLRAYLQGSAIVPGMGNIDPETARGLADMLRLTEEEMQRGSFQRSFTSTRQSIDSRHAGHEQRAIESRGNFLANALGALARIEGAMEMAAASAQHSLTRTPSRPASNGTSPHDSQRNSFRGIASSLGIIGGSKNDSRRNSKIGRTSGIPPNITTIEGEAEDARSAPTLQRHNPLSSKMASRPKRMSSRPLLDDASSAPPSPASAPRPSPLPSPLPRASSSGMGIRLELPVEQLHLQIHKNPANRAAIRAIRESWGSELASVRASQEEVSSATQLEMQEAVRQAQGGPVRSNPLNTPARPNANTQCAGAALLPAPGAAPMPEPPAPLVRSESYQQRLAESLVVHRT